jgi:hypothetical protein
MPSEHNLAEAAADLKSALDQANTYLSPKLESIHAHRLISFRENRSSTNLLGEWIRSGAGGPPPSLDPLQLRSQIYGFGRSASDAKAYRIVFLNICREFFSAALLALPLGKLTVPLTFARSIIERFAVACDVITKVQPIIRRPANNPREVFDNLVDAGEQFTIAMLGTKVDWKTLSAPDMTSVEKKSVKYSRKGHELDISAPRIGGRIKTLDSKIPGVGIAYDTLCEFLHPNVGDYWSSIVTVKKSQDSFGASHIEIGLGPEPTNLENSPEADLAIGRAIRTVIDVIALLPELDKDLKDISDRLNWRTQKLIRPLVKTERAFFPNDDPCPCQSGKRIAECCGSAR